MSKKIFVLLSLTICIACTKNNDNAQSIKVGPMLEQTAVYETDVPEPSALSFNPKRNSLYTVSDGNSTIYELDFQGKILSTFKTNSVDLEGISFSADCDTVYVAEEASKSISAYLMNGAKISSFKSDIPQKKNSSLEGVTVDSESNIWVVNEKKPCVLAKYSGNRLIYKKEIDFCDDASDIYYDESEKCLWLLSDESQGVYKLSESGELLASYSLPFRKGEGISIVGNSIYIINDSDQKLYVFLKP